MTSYTEDVLQEDWLRGNSWDIRLANGQPARTLDEVARALGTADITRVATDLLRLPFGKAAPDDLKVEAVSYLAELTSMNGEAKNVEAAETKKIGGIGKGTPDPPGGGGGGINIGGWWGLRGFSEALVVRDVEGRFVDRLGYGGIPDTGALGHRAGSPDVPKPDASSGFGSTALHAAVQDIMPNGGIPRVGPPPRANARQRTQQVEAINAIMGDLPEPLREPAKSYLDDLTNGSEYARAASGEGLMAAIEAHPQGSEAIAALINPHDVVDYASQPEFRTSAGRGPTTDYALHEPPRGGTPVPDMSPAAKPPPAPPRLEGPSTNRQINQLEDLLVASGRSDFDRGKLHRLSAAEAGDWIDRLRNPEPGGGTTAQGPLPDQPTVKPDLTPGGPQPDQLHGLTDQHFAAAGDAIIAATQAGPNREALLNDVYGARDKAAAGDTAGALAQIDKGRNDYIAASDGGAERESVLNALGGLRDAITPPDSAKPIPKASTTPEASNTPEPDWSGGWASDVPKTNPDGGKSVWGTRTLPDGTEVRLYRGPKNRVRFYDAAGNQHGEEQANVAPAMAYADSQGWHDPDSVRVKFKDPSKPAPDAPESGPELNDQIAAQSALVEGMTTTPVNFDPLDPNVDLSDPENYAKGRQVLQAAQKAKDYQRAAEVKKALNQVAKAGGIEPPVTGNRKADGQPYGSGFEPWHPQSDPVYDKYVEQVMGRIDAASEKKVDKDGKRINGPTDYLFMELSFDDAGQPILDEDGKQVEKWLPERAAAHERILDRLMEENAHVPKERRGVVLAGPPGSGKSTAIKTDGAYFGVESDAKGNPSNFAVVNPDEMKDLLIKEGLVPSEYFTEYGLGPLEVASPIHEESSYLAKAYKKRLMDEGYNVLLDGTYGGKPDKEQKKVDELMDQGYTVTGALVDGQIKQSYINAANRHQAPPATMGDPYAGRFVPQRPIDDQKVRVGADGKIPVSAIMKDAAGNFREQNTQNAVNFETNHLRFNGGAVWYSNDTGAAVRAHSTIPETGSVQWTQTEIAHLTALRSRLQDPAKQASLDERIQALQVVFGSLQEGKAAPPTEVKAGGADRSRGNAEQLRRYWTHGEGAAKIGYGTPGSFDRCVNELRPHMGERAKGYCANRIKEVTGQWPGQGHGGGHGGKADTPPTETTAQKPNTSSDFPDSIMVALYPDDSAARALAVPGGLSETDLHVTLAFLGKIDDYEPSDLDDLFNLVEGLAADVKPLTGSVNGVGRFHGTDPGMGDPVYVNVDVPGLADIQVHVAGAIGADGYEVSGEHGFTPHMTVRYDKGDKPLPKVEIQDIVFDFLSLSIGQDVYDFPLGVPLPSVAPDPVPAGETPEGEAPAEVADAPAPGDAAYTLADHAARGGTV